MASVSSDSPRTGFAGAGAPGAENTEARTASLATSTTATGVATPSDTPRHIETPGAFRVFGNNLIRFPSLMCFALAFLALPKSKFKSSITSTALNLSQSIVLSAAVGAGVLAWNKSLQDEYGENLADIGNAVVKPLQNLQTLFSEISADSLEKLCPLSLASCVIMAMSFKLSPLKFDANLSASYLLAGLLFACPPQELSTVEVGSWTARGREADQKVHNYKSFAVLMPVIVANLLAVTISSLLIMKRGISSCLSSFAPSCSVKVSTAVLISFAMLACYSIGRAQGQCYNSGW